MSISFITACVFQIAKTKLTKTKIKNETGQPEFIHVQTHVMTQPNPFDALSSQDDDSPFIWCRPNGRPTKYNFRKLKEIGYEILWDAADAAKVRSAASQHKTRNPGFNYKTSIIEVNGRPKIKVTRIEPEPS